MEKENLRLALIEVGTLVTSKLKGLASSQGFNASGNLDKSFRYESTVNELKLFAAKYAGALSEGISTGKGKGGFEEMQKSIIKWAKTKGIRPQIRDKQGRFTKVTDRTWKSLGFVLARSIRTRGISKRFGYKGSGFIKTVKEQTEKDITNIITEAYKKDLLIELNKRTK
tara:strand:+ start:76 stop:582 length:507 start_codon:yes stop_codon:yes gene_type:complete